MNAVGTPAAAAAAKAAAAKANRLAELAAVVQTRVTSFYGGTAVSSIRARADLQVRPAPAEGEGGGRWMVRGGVP